MIAGAQRSYATSPHLIVFPSMMLVVTVAAFVLLGDAVRDAVDAHVEVAARSPTRNSPGRRPGLLAMWMGTRIVRGPAKGAAGPRTKVGVSAWERRRRACWR